MSSKHDCNMSVAGKDVYDKKDKRLERLFSWFSLEVRCLSTSVHMNCKDTSPGSSLRYSSCNERLEFVVHRRLEALQ